MKLWTPVVAAFGVFVAAITAHAQTPTTALCPDDFAAYADTTDPVPCACTAEATTRGSVWGMDIYTIDSSVCRAALHAGVVAKSGGAVTVVPEAGRRAYPGVTRNGITSNNHGAYRGSFRFAAVPSPTTTTVSQSPVPAASTASMCPDNFAAYADTTEPVACACTPEATAQGSVWGMDIYTIDSSVCRAALHAGVVAKSGGAVTVIPEAGRQAYPGVTRNGITSNNHGAYQGSFRFAGAAPAPAAAVTPSSSVPAATTASMCPDNFAAYADTTDPVPCACTAEAITRGSVWGMDIYTVDSSVCRAALHAGAVAKSGGPVTVIPEAGRQAYPGVTRDGITSNNHGAYQGSFRFAGAAPAPAAAVVSPSPVPAASTALVCPDNFAAYADTTDPVACACTAEATARGSVWGMDIYTIDSSVCRAAQHAGVVAKSGGPVTVVPEAGRQAYPGVTRNGITSNNHGPYHGSFRFAAAAQPIMIDNKPAQQPIAATIQATGQVQLYIQFRFNSADLDVDAASTLMELREALAGSPSLRLMLVGHTDSIGTPQYNRTLSYRRAQSVMSWLVAKGVPAARLAVDGKGQDQPIADNSTDDGRALNRRVQAVRVR